MAEASTVAIEYAPKPPYKLVRQYVMGEVLGEGSQAKVREAVDARTLRRVAIKIVNLRQLRKVRSAEAGLRRRRQVGRCLLGSCQLLTRLGGGGGGGGAKPRWPFDVVCHTRTTCYMLPADAFRALCSSAFMRELSAAEEAWAQAAEIRLGWLGEKHPLSAASQRDLQALREMMGGGE